MAFALKIILIIFMINMMLYLGGYRVINDTQTNIISAVFDIDTLNSTINNPQASSSLINTIPQNQTVLQQIGTTFGALFTPVVFVFGIVTLLINLFFAPLSLFNVAGMPFAFKMIFGGGLMIAEVIIMLSLLSGRDI